MRRDMPQEQNILESRIENVKLREQIQRRQVVSSTCRFLRYIIHKKCLSSSNHRLEPFRQLQSSSHDPPAATTFIHCPRWPLLMPELVATDAISTKPCREAAKNLCSHNASIVSNVALLATPLVSLPYSPLKGCAECPSEILTT